MDMIVLLFVGLLLLGMGYAIGVKGKISLVHSYHYKNVAERDKPAFCKRIGLGNAIIGLAILSIPLLRPVLGEPVSLAIAGIAAVAAVALAIATILRYNGSLF